MRGKQLIPSVYFVKSGIHLPSHARLELLYLALIFESIGTAVDQVTI